MALVLMIGLPQLFGWSMKRSSQEAEGFRCYGLTPSGECVVIGRYNLNHGLGVMLRAMFALAAIPMAGQIAAGIHLEDIRFTGDTRLDGVNLEQCARSSSPKFT